MKHTKIIALIMAISMLFLTLASCNSSKQEEAKPTEENKTESPTQQPTEKPTESGTPDAEEGKIVMFANGAFVANLIRKDIVDDTDQTLYNTLRNAFIVT